MTPGRRGLIAHGSSLGIEPAQRPSRTAGRLGFLGAWLFGFENPRKRGLDFLGFPWILSSEIETYQWVTRDFRGKIFHRAFCPLGVRGGGTEGGRRGDGEARNCPSSKLNPGSDFLQSIVAPAVSISSTAFDPKRSFAARSARSKAAGPVWNEKTRIASRDASDAEAGSLRLVPDMIRPGLTFSRCSVQPRIHSVPTSYPLRAPYPRLRGPSIPH